MSVTVAPHGLWKSPISGDSFTARSVTLSQVRVDGPDTYWVEGHPRQGGRATLLRRRGPSIGSSGDARRPCQRRKRGRRSDRRTR